MKKFTFILVTTVYAITALGINIHFFYCCNKLSHISISAAKPVMDTCKSKTKKCCTDKTANIKLTTDQDKTVVKHISVPSYTLVPINQYTNAIYCAESGFINTKHPLLYTPPNRVSRLVLYCIFRI